MTIHRYGTNRDAKYFSPIGVSFEKRALSPGSEFKDKITFVVLKDIPCFSGEIAPWFDQPSGGLQYYTNSKIPDNKGNEVDATMENLEKYGYIQRVSVVKN